ncbi:hypothetical protein ACFXO9_01160 [Nocardia tengchongensis]|uniref:hypothetical protein n=1 Tax=Nocardia tengchongensis TaxID=2055889 RepID=UPI0036B2D7C7
MSLEFFNGLSGALSIELSEPTVDIAANLSNKRANSTAEIKALSFTPQVFQDNSFRDLTADELDRVVLESTVLNLQGEGEPVAHRAPNDKWFTVRDLVAAIAETERRTRPQSQWFGGIDVHHVFFEGLDQQEDGTWRIFWGS